MNFYPKNSLPDKEVKKSFLVFYIVGLLGFSIPFTSDFFTVITPFALLFSTYLLAVYHKQYSGKDIFVFLLIYVLGFFIEVVGVNTGILFGSYFYGDALGPKILGTPLMIGVNWLFLSYTSIAISERLSKRFLIQIILAPSLMLLYDIVLENIAPLMDMWYWNDDLFLFFPAPLKNFIAWWIIALLFTMIMKLSKINTKNMLAALVFVSQFLFFILLYIIKLMF